MENYVVQESEMEIETALRRDMGAVMSALSRRSMTRDELAAIRAKVAEAAMLAKKKPEEIAS
jgi:hypothetical protein